MAITLVALHADSDLPLTPAQAGPWLEQLKSSIGAKQIMTHTETEVIVEAATSLDGDEIVEALVGAFRAVGIAAGAFELAISEHEDDDLDFEAPPFFEETIDLAIDLE